MYKDFWQLYVRGYGGMRMAVVISIITMGSALLEGLNVGLLVPLLENLQAPGQESGHWVSGVFAGIYAQLGVPFGLGTILLGLGAFVVAISALKYVRTLLSARTAVDFEVWLRSSYIWDILHADMSYFHRANMGEQANTMITQVDRAGNSMLQLTGIAANLGIISAYVVAAFVLAPALTAAALSMGAVVSLLVQFHIARAKKLGTILVVDQGDFQTSVLESLSGIQVVKSFLLERNRWSKVKQAAEAIADRSYHLMKNQSQMTSIQEVSLFLMVGGIVYVGVAVLKFDIALVVALLFVLYRLMPRIVSLNSQRQALGPTMASLHSVKVAMDLTTRPEIVGGDKPFTGLTRGLEFSDVSFAYNDDVPVLTGTSFFIAKGKMTAIAGTSGAGKSTIVDLVLRNYDPTSGKLLVDGVNLSELDLESWRRSIGVVSQDVFLFNETIADNISLGRPGVSHQDVVDVAIQAHAHDFIRGLSDGYATLVGDRGWNLSGGERQRIALARAILGKPDILILDEATSSLDSESERMIQQYIASIRGTCTLVVIAHRMSTIQGADIIVVLEDGRIVEQGTWDSLLAEAGVFANFHRLQSVG